MNAYFLHLGIMKMRQDVSVQRNIERRYRSHCRCRKTKSTTYSECVFAALVILQARRMRRIILSPVGGLALPYFSTLSHKRQDFREKLLNIKCVF
jgi:hypothetical protein